MIGYIYTKLVIGLIQLLLLVNVIKNLGEMSLPPKNTTLIWSLWIIIFFVFIIVNLIDLVKYFLKGDINMLIIYASKIKILLIPYWILNFIISGSYWFILIGASHGFGMFLIPVPFISAICIFSLTSIYSILFILLYWKNGQIKNNELLIYLFSQFCFILDIIGIILLKNKNKRNKENNGYVA
jgi:hypothetical protein